MFLVYDTETTGFPLKDYKDPKNPRLSQLAWALINTEGKVLKKFSSLIEPCGWEFPTVAQLTAQGNKNPNFFVENNMSTERSLKEGRPIEFAMKHFLEAVDECKYIVAHNIKFDSAIMLSEMHRLNKFPTNKPIKICTMEASTEILKLPNPRGGYKWPNLTELHTYLFGKGFDGAHDAMADAKACANCFFELKKRKLISLPIIDKIHGKEENKT